MRPAVVQPVHGGHQREGAGADAPIVPAKLLVRRQELAHVLRAACSIAEDRDVVVVGSQAILGSYDEDDLPAVATMSSEADVAFLRDAERKALQVSGAIGELSSFHETFDYYVDAVELELIALPDGWEQRCVTWDLQSSDPARPRFVEPHDLAVAKLVAHREKDRLFVSALLDAGLIDHRTVVERARMLPEKYAGSVSSVTSWVESHRDHRK